jgi:hypothetical protein
VCSVFAAEPARAPLLGFSGEASKCDGSNGMLCYLTKESELKTQHENTILYCEVRPSIFCA